MSRKPFFVDNLERLFGADLVANLRQPIVPEEEKKPEATPTRVILARIDDPAEAFAVGMVAR